MIPYILVLIGLALIYAEFFLPGGIMGSLGGLSILGGLFIFITTANSPFGILLFCVGTLVGVGVTIRLALRRIKTMKNSSSIYSAKDEEHFIASSYDKEAIGKEGRVLSDLKPAGLIVIDGKRHSAISLCGYIPKDSSVIVTGGEGESLFVKSLTEEN